MRISDWVSDVCSSDLHSSAFVAEIVRRLQGQGAALSLPLTWLEQWLADQEQDIAPMVQLENRQQAADQVSISNSIGSLRLLAMTDWREFVEAMKNGRTHVCTPCINQHLVCPSLT